MSNSMDDVASKAELFFIIGSNTSEQHPVFGTMLRRAISQRGAKLIVADPRRIDMVDFATMHIRQQPGTDIALLNGLMYIILEKNWQDQPFIDERCENFAEYKETILQYPPQKASQITGVPVEQLYAAAELMATSKPMAVMWAMGITQHIVGVRNVMSLANLQMLLGNMGKPGGGVNPLRGQNNVQGACDMGGLPNVYTAYQPVINDAARTKFAQAWGCDERPRGAADADGASPNGLSPFIGATVTEMMPGILDGRTKALYIMGENPVTSDPDSAHIRHCLEQVDFLLLQDIFPTETAEFADILLPGVSFAEKTGTITNTERRVQMVNQAIPPLGQARQDWAITAELAKRVLALGGRQVNQTAPWAGWDYPDSSAILSEVNALTPSYTGITHKRLANGERLQWPVPAMDHPGTPILHTKGFARGLGRFMPIDHVPSPELPDDAYPLILSTGRVLYHWHGGAMTRRAKGLLEVYPEALIEVNEADALRLKVQNGQTVKVASRRGQIEAQAWITDRVPPGMIYANFHFPESSANELTIAALDPVAKIPSFKVCAVKLEPVAQPVKE